jgi:hypothetical protein
VEITVEKVAKNRVTIFVPKFPKKISKKFKSQPNDEPTTGNYLGQLAFTWCK